MPKRETAAPAGAPCWIELRTSDADKSRAFYCELFGWTADDPNEQFGGYFNFRLDGIRVGGAMAGLDVPDGWAVYLASDDAEKTAGGAAEHGGQVFLPAAQVGDLGTMAVVGDPGGAGIGIWQPGTHKGFGVHQEPGSPGWFELHTREYDACVAFYRDVFHWDTQKSDTPDFRYTQLKDGEQPLAGIIEACWLPEGTPAQWWIYFAVADADAAEAAITRLGGSIIQPVEDTPFGRLGTAADPTGVQFKLFQPAMEMQERQAG